eukprot:TRINITY_DN8849_c0_g1_i1.p2 TRINITY_DN8849_c0_g1~~TRINITY_DN8849_c0_g1_i1.p2  ORF type:complete len:333 (+),score=101.25 TRINITY_DN8849_c0_g1_i1:47-1045(+)
MKAVVSAVLLAGGAQGLSEAYVRANEAALWREYKAQYGRRYEGVDDARRRAVFAANMLHYADMERANPGARFGADQFSDMTREEFNAAYAMPRSIAFNAPAHQNVYRFTDAEYAAAAAVSAIDWRDKGCVTSVKQQGQCGSCWSFSTAGNIEGQWAAAGNRVTDLSEQELVDCDKNDHGCGGGYQDHAFKWLLTNRSGEIVTDAAYPYTSGATKKHGTCQDLTGKPVGAKISNYTMLAHNETDMAAWVATKGPLSVGVDATFWFGYKGGVMTYCQGRWVDHAVLVVGYGHDGVDYWIIKNSWGAEWGESGYIRITKGNNQCLITTRPTSSIV